VRIVLASYLVRGASTTLVRLPLSGEPAGCRQQHEHRASPPVLAPHTGWAMGNAGIIRELLRYARIRDGQSPRYAVAWPRSSPGAVTL
jgi:hypothetical protein